MPTISPAWTVKLIGPNDAPRISSRRSTSASRAIVARCSAVGANRPSHHAARQPVSGDRLVVVDRRDQLSVTQHGDAIAVFADLVEVVRHDDHPAAAGRESMNPFEQQLDTFVAEHVRRLVDEEHRRPSSERPGEFDQLLLLDRQAAHDRPQREVESDLGERCASEPIPTPSIDDTEPRVLPLAAEQHVLGNGQGRRQQRLLRDQRDSLDEERRTDRRRDRAHPPARSFLNPL